LPIAAKFGRWETVGKGCSDYLAVRELTSTNPVHQGQKLPAFFRWLSAADVYPKIREQAKRLAVHDGDPRLITAMNFEAEFWALFLKPSFLWLRRESLQGWRSGFGIFDLPAHVFWIERVWWDKALASPKNVMKKSWAAAEMIPEGERKGVKQNMEDGLKAWFRKWRQLYDGYLFSAPLAFLHIFTPGLSSACLREAVKKIIEYRRAREDPSQELASIIEEGPEEKEKEGSEKNAASELMEEYFKGDDSGLKLHDLWCRLHLDDPALLSSFKRLANNPSGSSFTVDDSITTMFRSGNDAETRPLFESLSRTLGPLPSSDAVVELNFSVLLNESMGQSHSASDSDMSYRVNELYGDGRELKKLTQHWKSFNHKTDETSAQLFRDLQLLEGRIAVAVTSESELSVRSLTGKRTSETRSMTDAALLRLATTEPPSEEYWKKEQEKLTSKSTTYQIRTKLVGDLKDLHLKMAVLLHMELPGHKGRQFVNSAMGKDRLEVFVKLHLRFLWDLFQQRDQKIGKPTVESLVKWVGIFSGSTSVYPRWAKQFKGRRERDPSKIFQEREPKSCEICGVKHSGGILCFLGITSLRLCFTTNDRIVSDEDRAKKNMAVYKTRGEEGEGLRYVLDMVMRKVEAGGDPLRDEVARRKRVLVEK